MAKKAKEGKMYYFPQYKVYAPSVEALKRAIKAGKVKGKVKGKIVKLDKKEDE